MAVDRAIVDLKKLLAKDPNDTRALVRLAEQHVKAGDVRGACELYARAGDVLVRLGFARRAISALAQALECARVQVATHDRVAPIARAMAKLYVAEKLPRDAVVILDGAARFLAERGLDVDASAVLEERLVIDAADAARVGLAESLLRRGEIELALAQLELAFRRLLSAGARDEAIEVGEKLLHHRKDVAVSRACAELYLARLRSGDPFLALAKLRVCCTADPTHVPTLELLAKAFDLANHPDKAARVRAEIAAVLGKTTKSALPKLVPPPPKKRDESAERVDAGWDEVAAPTGARIDVNRASFWAVPDAELPEDNDVVSVSLSEIEVEGAPESYDSATMLEAALERVDVLASEGRFEEASLLLSRHLEARPSNALLLERKSEIESLRSEPVEGLRTMTA
jgi:tetratricopeptide (TPR) repeat protein